MRDLAGRMRSEGCAVIDLLGPDEVQSLLQAWQDLKVTSQRGFDSTILSTDPHYRMQVDRQIRLHIAARTTILAPGHRIAFCTFAVKAAYGAGSEVPLHQDWSFVDETRFASFGLWCPLVDVGPENGCLQVVKGSHAFPHPPRAACSPFAYPELVEQLSARVTSLPMRAGQAVVFDNRLFHCSPPNRTAFERVAATAVIVPCECRLRYYHMPDRTRPYLIEVFEVDDSFYLSHVAPGRPMAGKSLGFVDVRDDGSTSRTQPGQGRP